MVPILSCDLSFDLICTHLVRRSKIIDYNLHLHSIAKNIAVPLLYILISGFAPLIFPSAPSKKSRMRSPGKVLLVFEVYIPGS